MDGSEKKGYLDKDFRIFHLCDSFRTDISYHYHDFNKVLIFLSGDVTYCIEGRKYELKPHDVVLINAGEMHRPVVNSDSPYERIIIYISSGFTDSFRTPEYDLGSCFVEAARKHANVLRIENLRNSRLYSVCRELEASFEQEEYALELYQKVLFLQFMILLNRALKNQRISYLENIVTNRKIADILDYINNHLKEELSVDSLAARFYISRSYLMHLFKDETGYSVGNYINEKRLLSAKAMIQNGVSVTEACYASGFRDYSTFARAFKKKFRTTPRNSSGIL